LTCDAGVGHAGHELFEDGPFTLGELGKGLAGDGRRRPIEEAENAARDAGADDKFALLDRLHRTDDRVLVRALQQVASGSGPQRRPDRRLVVGHGEDEDADGRAVPGERAGDVQPVHAGHVQVDDRDIRAEPADRVARFAAVGGFSDDLQPVGRGESASQAAAKYRMVIGNNDANHVRSPIEHGSQTPTVVPLSCAFAQRELLM
jgi:hypothetical protein